MVSHRNDMTLNSTLLLLWAYLDPQLRFWACSLDHQMRFGTGTLDWLAVEGAAAATEDFSSTELAPRRSAPGAMPNVLLCNKIFVIHPCNINFNATTRLVSLFLPCQVMYN